MQIFEYVVNFIRVKHFSNMDNQGDKSEVIFKGTEDRFSGITVDTLKEHCSTDIFPKKLEGKTCICE